MSYLIFIAFDSLSRMSPMIAFCLGVVVHLCRYVLLKPVVTKAIIFLLFVAAPPEAVIPLRLFEW